MAKSKEARHAAMERDAQRRTRDHGDLEQSESRPTPGSAEGERDPAQQSESNVPRRDDEPAH